MIRQLSLLAGALLIALGGYFAAYRQVEWSLLAFLLGGVALTLAAQRLKAEPVVNVGAGLVPAPQEPAVTLETLESAAMLVDVNLGIVAVNAAAIDAFGALGIGDDLRVAIRHPVVIECVSLASGQRREAVREIDGIGRNSAFYRLRAAPAGEGRLLVTFTDVSPARLAERMRADFVANASHELRTPLATLVGFIETLQGPAADDVAARDRFLKVMGDEAARMTRLIDDLLSLSRIELDKNVRPREIISLPPILASLASSSAMALEADGRKLEIRHADLPKIVGDNDQILQILHNLLSNAVKYGRTGTPIVLSAEPATSIAGEVVRLTIEDIGDGIPPEHIPRLTERFYRVDTGRSRRLGGTGLGLAIVKHIVERHRGALEISSEIGKGTRVSFTLPAAMSQN